MNKFVLLAIIFASLSGVGVLSHNMFPITLQSLQVFSSIDEFTNPICSCAGPDGLFSPENCNGFAGDYQDPNGLCTGIASVTEYGEPPKILAIQGCGVGFWKNNAIVNPSIASIESDGDTVWPPGYQPDYYYADMFQTTLVKPQSVIEENEQVVEEINEKEKEIHSNDVIAEDESNDQQTEDNEEITEDDNNETKDDNEKVNEETNTESEDNEIHSNDVIAEDESKEDATGVQIIPPTNDDKSNDKEEKAKVQDKEEKHDVVKSAKGPTLLEALELKGGKENALLRQSVAAMLNAAHSDINYPYTVSEIIALTQIALSTENYEKLIVIFEENNENQEKPPLCSGN